MKKLKMCKIPAWISGGGVLFLSSACLFAVGFSAWTFGGSTNGSGDLTAAADDLIDLRSIFQVQKPNMFRYGPYGIIEDETIVSSGSIYFPILIDCSATGFEKVLSLGNGGLSFTVKITNESSFDIFNANYLKRDSTSGQVISAYSLDPNVFQPECNFECRFSVAGSTLSSTIDIPKSSGLLETNIYCNIRLSFEFSDFANDVYSSLSTSGLAFSIDIKAVNV